MNRNRIERLFFLVIFLLPLVSQSHAGVFKCKGQNGKTEFRDEPCSEGNGGKFNLGSIIEDSDPTGTKGDVSGSFGTLKRSYSIQDALGVLRKSKGELSLYLIPSRYTSKDVEHFQDVGDASIFNNKPSLDPASQSSFPYLNLLLIFKKNSPLTPENIESLEIRMFGLQANAKPLLIKLKADAAKESIPYFTIFENVTEGDINLDTESEIEVDGKHLRWKASIRAPIYFH